MTVEAEKILHGKTLCDGEFTFVIADSKGTPVTSGTNKADGTIRFEKELSYEIEDLNRMRQHSRLPPLTVIKLIPYLTLSKKIPQTCLQV